MKILAFLLSAGITILASFVIGFNNPASIQGSDAMRDPWTYEARTFNPAGVKYTSGVTTGREISSRLPAAWSIPVSMEVLKELKSR
jgi:hypothetical protein